MPQELDVILAHIERLERQLRLLKIAAGILVVLALVMALAPGAWPQP